ncbi:MAG TPA: hypothetical protein VFS21_33075, partial [Roseiflexaceae bacterium]|nr:hypothetical protein [Roseiflexaceae bacterium]
PAPVGRLLLQAQSLPEQVSDPAGPFRDAWERAGGADVLGEALSPPLEQGGRLVQFFAYGTLEADPGGIPAPGGAGRRLLDARGLSEEWQIEQARNT